MLESSPACLSPNYSLNVHLPEGNIFH